MELEMELRTLRAQVDLLLEQRSKDEERLSSPTFIQNQNALRVTECCLDEWETGDRIKIQFSAAMYEDKYRSHCNTLSSIASKQGGANVVKKLCLKIMKRAM